MIVSGQCRAFRTVGAAQGSASRQETLAIMGAGDVFGELALILNEPRAASVEAVDQVTVLVLDKKTMAEGLGIDGWTGSLVRLGSTLPQARATNACFGYPAGISRIAKWT